MSIGLKRTSGAAILLAAMAFAGDAFAGGPSVTIASSANPSNAGQSVDLTTTVGASNGAFCPGTVTYSKDGGTSPDAVTCAGSNTQTLVNQGNNTGKAICTATFNSTGTIVVRSRLTSSNNNANGCTNNSAPFTQTVNAAPVSAVPTLADWAKYGMIALMMGSGLVVMARRNRGRFGL